MRQIKNITFFIGGLVLVSTCIIFRLEQLRVGLHQSYCLVVFLAFRKHFRFVLPVVQLMLVKLAFLASPVKKVVENNARLRKRMDESRCCTMLISAEICKYLMIYQTVE
jgi:hypothetical protein